MLSRILSLSNAILGRPLASWEAKKEQLSLWTGVPVLGVDALASTGYGPEAALTALLPLGIIGLRYYVFIEAAIVLNLFTLYLSYRQTAATYPDGGGAYVVAKDNLGIRVGIWAAIVLMVDYLLNVAVGIAAGVGAVISAVPALHSHTLLGCLVVLTMLTVLNLRGVRETGIVFVIPVFVFGVCISIAIALGLFAAIHSGGSPHPVIAPPSLPKGSGTLGAWIILAAFANGCTAMTGIEAVSNGVPLFKEPKVPNAQRTLTVIFVILGAFLLSLGYLCPAYHIMAMDEHKPGYQSILSQLIGAVAGRGAFYYVSSASIFIVLTYSAQTSFADFPRVCRLLAEDGFLPPFFAERGRRLVYSAGIIILAVLSGLLLIMFGGVTDNLIPLFAVGAFGAFVLSQVGMVAHWLRKSGRGSRIKLAYNTLGAATTAVALVIIVAAKFAAGAWMTIIVIPALVLLLTRTKHHYESIDRELKEPVNFAPSKPPPPIVLIPISNWNRAADNAVRLGMLLSDDITALHVSTDTDHREGLKRRWERLFEDPREIAVRPRLHFLNSPYRNLYQPILDYIDNVERDKPDRLIAIVIPELVEPHWYQYALHALRSRRLRYRLHQKRDERVFVVSAQWYLREG